MIAFQPRLEAHMPAGRRRPPQPAQMPLTLPGPESAHRTGGLNGTAHAAVSGKVRSAPALSHLNDLETLDRSAVGLGDNAVTTHSADCRAGETRQ